VSAPKRRCPPPGSKGAADELAKSSLAVYLADAPSSRSEAALFYASCGLAVVPLHDVRSGMCSCAKPYLDGEGKPFHKSAGKHPRTVNGSSEATTDAGQITKWWDEWPRANVGVRADGTSVVILDVDPRNGGDVTLKELEVRYGALPDTPTVGTGGGGLQYYFKHIGNPLHSSKTLGPGVDLIGVGNCGVAPPSRHANGKRYRWLEGCPDEPALLPKWAARLAEPNRKKVSERGRGGAVSAAALNGKQNNGPAPFDGDFRLEDLLKGVPEGQRDDVVFRYACSLRGRGISKREAEILITAAYEGLDEGSHPFTLDDALKKIDEAWDRYEAPASAHANSRKPSAASLLIELASALCELFHDHQDAYASITIDRHRETYRLRSSSFRLWLRQEYFAQHEMAASGQALTDAIGTLEGTALFNGEQRSVFLRVAKAGSSIYVDLGDESWRAVKITPSGWSIVRRPGVRFWRPRGYLPLPVPERGGSVAELREFANIEEADFLPLCGVIIKAFCPGVPGPILPLNGEQGSAKTTLCRVLRKLIDPNRSPLKRPPHNSEDLMVAAHNNYLLVFDNVSSVPDSLSDDLCALATGTGWSTRQLYTNFEEAIFEGQRPIILNGIEELGTRPDLLDRMVPITLPAIADADRVSEGDFWERFEEAAPRIIGAFFDAVAVALSRIDQIELEARIRMADFCEWAVAATPAFGCTDEEMLGALLRNRERAAAAALESSPLVEPLHLLLAENGGKFVGNATNLLKKLRRHLGDEGPPRDWPTAPKSLGDQLRRLVPDLRRQGIEALFIKNRRTWRITRIQE